MRKGWDKINEREEKKIKCCIGVNKIISIKTKEVGNFSIP